MLTKTFLLNLQENCNKTFCVTDIETTGQKPDDSEIIEIATIKVKEGKIIEEFSSLIKPDFPIPDNITLLTGINNGHVKDAPKITDVLNDWLNFIKNGDYFCAHNVSFDHDFIYQYLKVCNLPTNNLDNLKFFCTVRVARILFSDLPSRKLKDLIKHFNITVSRRHRASDDAKATAELLLIFLNEIKQKKEMLLNFIESTQKDKIKTHEVAEYLSMPKQKIYEMVKTGQLEVAETYKTKNGYDGYLFLRKDIEALVSTSNSLI